MPSLKEFLDALTASWPVAAAATLGSALILYLHRIHAPYVEQMPEWATTTIVVVGIYGVFVWLVGRPAGARSIPVVARLASAACWQRPATRPVGYHNRIRLDRIRERRIFNQWM